MPKSLLYYFLPITLLMSDKGIAQIIRTDFITEIPAGNSENFFHQIDSVSRSNETAGAFARMYVGTMKNITEQMQKFDTSTQAFIIKFETAFADEFLTACKNDYSKLHNAEWEFFFSNKNIPAWKSVLLGVNAHVNIDIWQSLVTNFSEEEIRQYKKALLSLQSSVSKIYRQLFDTLLANSRYLRVVNFITLHLDKKLGERILYKWRKRNIELALLYYTKPGKFRRKWAMIRRKKNRNDQIILKSGPMQKNIAKLHYYSST